MISKAGDSRTSSMSRGAAAAIRARRLPPVELTDRCLAAAAQLNPVLHAFNVIAADEARAIGQRCFDRRVAERQGYSRHANRIIRERRRPRA